MAQHDYIISNQTFPNTRADINNLAEAVATNNSGTSAPTTQYAGQFWIDTTSTTWTLYIHDGTDDIQFATIDTSANTVNFIDSALDVVTDTTPQLGGDLDLNSNDITGTGNINITGTATFSSTVTGQDFRHAGDSDTYFGFPAENQLQLVGGNSEILKAYRIAGAYGILQVNGSGSSTYPNFTFNGDSNTGMYRATTDTLAFTTGGSERLRIDSSGNFLYAKTTTDTTTTGVEFRPSGLGYFGRSGGQPIIANRNTNDGDIIELRKDGSPVGSIGVKSTDNLYIADSNDAGITFIGTGVSPVDSDGAGNPNALDLGDSFNTWKDLYLSGNIYLGGTGSANALDDYEEGSWTPTVAFGGGSVGQTYASRRIGKYTKIGRFVHLEYICKLTDIGSSTGTFTITGLPFSHSSTDVPFATGTVMLAGITHDGHITSNLDSGSSELTFRTTATNGTRTVLTNSNWSDNDEIAGVITYIT